MQQGQQDTCFLGWCPKIFFLFQLTALTEYKVSSHTNLLLNLR